MSKIIIRFEPDASLDHLEVVVRGPQRDEQAEQWLERLKSLTQSTLTVYDQYGNLNTVPASEVVLVSVEGKTLTVRTQHQDYYAKISLQRLEQALEEHSFVRISRYELVNLKMVQRFEFTGSGTLKLELRGGGSTWASRRCIPAIRRKLEGRD